MAFKIQFNILKHGFFVPLQSGSSLLLNLIFPISLPSSSHSTCAGLCIFPECSRFLLVSRLEGLHCSTWAEPTALLPLPLHPICPSRHKFHISASRKTSMVLHSQMVFHYPFSLYFLLSPHLTYLSWLHAPRKQACWSFSLLYNKYTSS